MELMLAVVRMSSLLTVMIISNRILSSCLLQTSLEDDAEVSCSGYVKVYVNRIICHPITDARKCYEGEKILVSAIKDTVFEHCVWNKLWRRELFDHDCRFPLGKCFEDSATTWKVLRIV